MDIIIHLHVYEYTVEWIHVLQWLHLNFSVNALIICDLGFFKVPVVYTFFFILLNEQVL